MTTRYDIPCVHESGTPTSEVHSDYHPLTIEEIAELSHIAVNADMRTTASIQNRLTQGIPGIQCPHQGEGEVAERMYHLDEYYARNVKFYGNDHTFAQALYNIMTTGQE